MDNLILTPVTLWKDFDDTLPLEEEVLSEKTEGGFTVKEICFLGRRTKKGRVKIYTRYFMPQAESFPAVMILFEAQRPFDREFVDRFLQGGYGVLCVDYCGEDGTDRPHTQFPEDVAYANFNKAGRRIEYADETARETSWYEWAAVARYAVRFLSGREEVTAVGAIGLRTGGEVLFKIAPYAPLACMVSVCAAGWLAYREHEKFSNANFSFDDERHRFIAGIDSQSYAPYIKCPVLLLSAVNDRKYNFDRVYDTFVQISPKMEKAILFSAHGNGLIGSHSLTDLELFLDKYLKGHSVFVCSPLEITAQKNGKGELVVRMEFDPHGEIADFGIFFTEKTEGRNKDWTRVLGKKEDIEGNVGTVPLSLYRDSGQALVYAFVRYSNNFSVTSRILSVKADKDCRNLAHKSRVLYSNSDGLNGFTTYCLRAGSVADCFHRSGDGVVRLEAGYGGIIGITSGSGMISYRVGEDRYHPDPSVVFRFDAWSAEGKALKVTFFKDTETVNGYSNTVWIDGGGKWKSILMGPADFKSANGTPLDEFTGVQAVLFECEGVLINNVLWI